MPAYDDRRFAPPAPVASVSLRHSDQGGSIADVPMLIDSGADATLLPKSAVASLGITGTGERYQLAAFDGTTSESEAVRVDLVFMNRRFIGRFLVIDAEVGVIGRNVLSHVRLLLDGPVLNWEERPSIA
jgi:Aspartyl protease